MAVYVPPQSDQVILELSAYTIPDSLQVNFELLESVGTQVVVWDVADPISEYVEFEFINLWKVLRAEDYLIIEEAFQFFVDPLLIQRFDTRTVTEHAEVRVDPLVIDAMAEITVTDELNTGLDKLPLDISEEITAEDVIEIYLAHVIDASEDIIAIEEAELLDFVVEIFLITDDVAIEEAFSTWTDWHNLWSPDQGIVIFDFPIIGRDPEELGQIDFIGHTENVRMIMWYLPPWDESTAFDTITATDEIDRLLVGHFPWPLEDITVQDILTEIECFPPYPFPIELVHISESWSHTMIPPSLSWIEDHPTVYEWLVVGEDPHYADLGYQEIHVTEVPVLSPNPLYLEAQDVGDIVPFIREVVRYDVGFPVNTKEDIVTVDELTVFYISELMPFFIDNVGHDEQIWVEVDPMGIPTVSDNLAVGESLVIVLSVIPVEPSETVTVQETFDGWTGQEISVVEDIISIEDTAFVLDLIVEVPELIESLLAWDMVILQIAPREINAIQNIAIEENFFFLTGYPVLIFTTVAVQEVFTFGLTPLHLTVQDQIVTISEYAATAGELKYSVFRFLEITESVRVALAEFPLEVSDSITVDEQATGIIALPASAYDDVNVAEDYASFVTVIFVSSQDAIVAEEAATVEVISGAFISVHETVATQDIAEIEPLYWNLNAQEFIAISEFVDVYDNIHKTNVYETIAIDELAAIDAGLRDLTVADQIAISESREVFDNIHRVSLAENIAIGDQAQHGLTPLEATVGEILAIVEALDIKGAPEIQAVEDITASDSTALAKTPLFLDLIDTVLITENLAIPPMTRFLEAFQAIGITEFVLVGHEYLAIQATEDIAIDELNRLTDTFIAVWADDQITIQETTELPLEHNPVLDESITVEDQASIGLVHLTDQAQQISIAEHVLLGLNPQPLFVQDGITTEEWARWEVSAVLLDSLIDQALVWEWANIFVSPDHWKSFEDAVTVTEWAQAYVIIFAFSTQAITIQDVPQIAVTPLHLAAQDEVHAGEDVATQQILQFLAFDYTTITEWATPYADALAITETELILIQEEATLETTGIAPSRHDNIFIIGEDVYLTLTPLNISVRDYASIVEWTKGDDTILGMEFLTAEEAASLALDNLHAEFYEILGSTETAQVLVFDSNTCPVVAQEVLTVAEATSQFLDVLWTGIQTDFPSIEEAVELLCGILIETGDTISTEEAVEFYFGVLQFFVADEIDTADTGGAWHPQAEAIQGFDSITVQDRVTMSNPLLYLEVFDTATVESEYAETGEAIWMTAVDVVSLVGEEITAEHDVLVLHALDSIFHTESLIIGGLPIRIDVYDTTGVSDTATATPGALDISVEDQVATSETAQFWDQTVIRSDAVHINEWTFLVCFPPDIVRQEHIAIGEWAYAQVQPIDITPAEDIGVQEDATVYVELDIHAIEEIYTQEDNEFSIFPPVIVSRETIPVREVIILKFDPFKVEVYETVSVADTGFAYIFLGAGLLKTEDIAIEEWVALARTGTAWYLGAAENITVLEDPAWGLDPIPLAAWEEAIITEAAIMTDLVIELGVVADEIQITEAMQASNPIVPGEAQDEAQVEDSATVDLQIAVHPTNQITVQEAATLDIPISLTRWESIGIGELVTFFNRISTAGTEDLVVEEVAQVALATLYPTGQEGITTEEEAILALQHNVLVADTVTIQESAQQEPAKLPINRAESIGIQETATLATSPLVFVVDIVATTEAQTTSLPELNTNIYETITAGDPASARPDRLMVGANEDLAIEEAGAAMPWPKPDVFNSISTEEDLAIQLDRLNIGAQEGITTSESTAAFPDPLYVQAIQLVAVMQAAPTELMIWVTAVEFLWGNEQAYARPDHLFSAIADWSTTEEDLVAELRSYVQAQDATAITQSVQIDLPLPAGARDNVGLLDFIQTYLGIDTEGTEDISLDEHSELNIPIKITGITLVDIGELCYTQISIGILLTEDITTLDMAFWGLSLLQISVEEQVTSDAIAGMYVEPYVLYPMLFDAPEHGEW